MKIIISYQDGSSEIIAVAATETILFLPDKICIEYTRGNVVYINYRDLRSLVIA